jgi:hypothetical protein
MSLLDKIKRGLVDGFHIASDITSEYTKIGRIKIDLLGLKKEIEEKMLELGGRVYEESKSNKITNIEVNKEIISLIEEIRKLEDELKRCEIKLEEIKKLDETAFYNVKK